MWMREIKFELQPELILFLVSEKVWGCRICKGYVMLIRMYGAKKAKPMLTSLSSNSVFVNSGKKGDTTEK